MIKNRDIIIFGDDWGRYPSTIQYIAKELAPDNRIIWIGSLGLRKPKLSARDFSRILEKLKKKNSGTADSSRNGVVYEIHPRIIPWHDNKYIRRLNSRVLEKTIKENMRQLNFKNPVVITASPIVGDLAGKIGESSFNYLCLDDWSEFEGAFRSLTNLEQQLLQNVDSCFAISELLVQNRKPLRGKSFFLPQGVNFDHFSRPKKIPPEFASLKKPVIGFFGLIANYIDLEVIRESALRYPEYTFIIIGKTTVDLSRLVSVKNIIYTGPVDYTALPDYATVFDAGLIPFQLNDLTIAANPLKLIEYLSLGIPVISTALPEVKKFGKHVYCADNNEEFVSMIERAVKEDNDQKREERRATASQYSWHSVAERISTIIEQIEEQKKSS